MEQTLKCICGEDFTLVDTKEQYTMKLSKYECSCGNKATIFEYGNGSKSRTIKIYDSHNNILETRVEN